MESGCCRVFFCNNIWNNLIICINRYTNAEKFTIVSLIFVKNPLNNLINDDKINFLNFLVHVQLQLQLFPTMPLVRAAP